LLVGAAFADPGTASVDEPQPLLNMLKARTAAMIESHERIVAPSQGERRKYICFAPGPALSRTHPAGAAQGPSWVKSTRPPSFTPLANTKFV
jgi:hypothetical protein